MLLLILQFLAEQLETSHTAACREPAKDLGEIFRLDAKAAGDDVAIGGWVSRGGRATREARWFAVRLNRRNAPLHLAVVPRRTLLPVLGVQALRLDRVLAPVHSDPSDVLVF